MLKFKQTPFALKVAIKPPPPPPRSKTVHAGRLCNYLASISQISPINPIAEGTSASQLVYLKIGKV